MSFKLEPVIWSLDTGQIGIHGGVDGPTVVRLYGRMVTKTLEKSVQFNFSVTSRG